MLCVVRTKNRCTHNSSNNQSYYKEKLEDTKGVIRSRKSNRQCNGQMKKNKTTNNNLQITTKKIKARATRTPQTTGTNVRASELCGVPATIVAPFLLCFCSSCVPYVASFSGLSILHCSFGVR
jgi:hypothetical protein